jgi:S1-C subfamily serine protease
MIAAAASPSLRVAHALRAFAGATEDGADDDKPPPGCSRYEVRIKKPLGLVLEEDKTGKIFVAEILEDSNAAKSGLINVGDQLLATSAMVFNSTSDYGGVSVKKGEETIRFATRGEDFKTVMAAIGTVPSQRLVTLEFQKCI